MKDIKPCPFCGGEDLEIDHASTYDVHHPDVYEVHCPDCGGRGGEWWTDAEAIAAWNTRAERTCKHERMFNLVERECDGKRYSWRDMDMPNYCPNCGAKVVN